jgi:hypothetical protein
VQRFQWRGASSFCHSRILRCRRNAACSQLHIVVAAQTPPQVEQWSRQNRRRENTLHEPVSRFQTSRMLGGGMGAVPHEHGGTQRRDQQAPGNEGLIVGYRDEISIITK